MTAAVHDPAQRRRRRRACIAAASVLAAAVAAAVWALVDHTPAPVTLTPGRPVVEALRGPGSSVVLAPGVHDGFAITEAGTTVRAEPGATVAGEIRVLADDVHLDGLEIAATDNGITARAVEGLRLSDVRVTGPRLHGIELVDAAAEIRGCSVERPRGELVQGIEIRNASGRQPTLVEGCTVRGGKEGIVTHVSRATVRGNRVAGQTERGITITEMSEGLVEENTLRDLTGAAVFCGDMSHCEIRNNDIAAIRADDLRIQSRAGQAVVGWYYATLRVHDNVIDVAADPAVDLRHGSVAVERFPLSVWWHGAGGLRGGLTPTVGFLVVLGGLRLTAWPLVRRLERRRRGSRRRPSSAAPALLSVVVGVFVVQSFHMLEHGVQVFQTYVASAEHRSGLLGVHADTEWVHFVYNAAVIAFLVLLARWVHTERSPLSRGGRAWLAATVALQGYHMLEHTVKLGQHLATGIDPAPGLLGGRLGLVWFHFGVNLAVHAGLTVVAVELLRRRSRRRARATATPAEPARPGEPGLGVS